MTSINVGSACGEEQLYQPDSLKKDNGTKNRSTHHFTVLGTRERFWSTCISTLVASIPALLIGYTIVFPSSALLVLLGSWDGDGSLPSQSYQFSTVLLDVFGALGSVGAIFGGPVAGWIADRWGRKFSLIFCAVPYLLGYLLLSYAHYTSTATSFKTILLIGIFISGLGMGWASTTTSIYIGEISSSKLRGFFGTIMQLFIGLGILLCYYMGTIFIYYHVALGACMTVTVFVVLSVWLKETPRWLLATGQSRRAFMTLQWLRGPHYEVDNEFNTMKEFLAHQDDTTAPWKEFRKKSIIVPTVTLLIVFFFQQIGGLNAQGAYGTLIFKEAGVSNPQFTSAMSIGVTATVGTIISAFVVDKMGRKPLLVISAIGMGIGSTLLGLHFYITRPALCSGNSTKGNLTENFSMKEIDSTSDTTLCNTQYGPLAIVSIVTYNLMFAIGFGPISWILLPELLPLKVRGLGGGLAVFVNWATSALVTGTYLSYADAITPWFAWWTFALLNFLSIVFVLVALVETKGKNLEVIQTAFEKKWHYNNNNNSSIT